jgi:hypothetical protein
MWPWDVGVQINTANEALTARAASAIRTSGGRTLEYLFWLGLAHTWEAMIWKGARGYKGDEDAWRNAIIFHYFFVYFETSVVW